MPERTSYTQGTPNWVDLQTPNQDAAKVFYSGLFGWTYDDQPMPDGPVYSMAMLGVMDAGRMAFVMDPSGAPVALWQANQHIGAGLVNEPGTVNWNELITTDPGAAAFYQTVVGLTTSKMDMGAGEYTLFEANGQMVGGTTPPQMPGMPNHWHVYFGVADADATVAKATELGGSVLVPPFDTPVGRMAVIADPQGAVFSIIKQAPQPA